MRARSGDRRTARARPGRSPGTVRRADNMSAIGGAEVHATGPGNRGVGTSPTGQYSMLLPVGTYTVTVTVLTGFTSQTVSNVTAHAGPDDDAELQPRSGSGARSTSSQR